ncbi:NADH dehydrogenase [ubiquinone] iron-sulfur protein 5 [Daktulosphaira vitifoliae]|uniref:NADH dehydrogenase [ubiquinone] iron-sulfur protein 5 n=1 Tax=Daktulosphaira vitifoliae TaxID=58002 RepID=UPI0021AAF118|nr:NADH dehydrogenase [ubiquinone] iron-sulfur protein 5 [Daktulosphaira vitifoliae]
MFFFTPFIRNPITDLTGPIMTAQLGQRCAEFEMRMMNCFEAYGNPLGYQKCQDYYEDFKECCTREKQMTRIYAIQKERSLQAKIQGKGKEYENPPVMHTF